jgi:putative spermidine/putrescine transport system ATP-binding protein
VPIAQLQQVSKRFGSVRAVDSVSLDVEEGEFLSLLGPSGCGKTTTLRLLAGLEMPDEGDISIDGRSALDRRPYERNLGMVFQSYALFPHLTVFRNVAFGLERRRVPAAEAAALAAEALALVRLDPGLFGPRRPAELSGGQRQRVALARALVLKPRMLLLDEPLAAVDAKLRRAMQLELRELQRRLGTTFVYVTHDQDEALTMSDRVAVMEAGRLVQLGSPATIYEAPRTRFVASFIGEMNLFDGLAVRPERTLIAGSAGELPAGVTSRSGTVREVLYQGEMLRVIVAIEGETDCVVALRNDGASAQWTRGARVAVGWHSSDARRLEDG